MLVELNAGAPNSISQIDVAASHSWAFVLMMILMLVFGVGRVQKKPKRR
jgi:hypothetical protein